MPAWCRAVGKVGPFLVRVESYSTALGGTNPARGWNAGSDCCNGVGPTGTILSAGGRLGVQDEAGRGWGMGRLVFGMMQSLDGYIAANAQLFGTSTSPGVPGGPALPPPGPALGRHFNDHVRGLAGMLYGRRMYEVMRYWDEDQPDWDEDERDFAAAWRPKPKWVASHSLKSVGANATLVMDDVGAFAARLKAEIDGDIDVAGAELAGSLTKLGLIDEYRLYLRPFVLGGGKPYFAAARPPLRLVKSDVVGEDAVRLVFVPA